MHQKNFLDNFVGKNRRLNILYDCFMKTFYIGLGSNIGERCDCLDRAIALIGERAGKVVARSSFYETVADGFVSDNLFMNAVVAVESDLSPCDMLSVTRAIELDMGCLTHRNADGSYCDRSLDIDILACEDVVCDTPALILPHPRMHLRRFVLEPLCEIAPQWLHPTLSQTAVQLLTSL